MTNTAAKVLVYNRTKYDWLRVNYPDLEVIYVERSPTNKIHKEESSGKSPSV